MKKKVGLVIFLCIGLLAVVILSNTMRTPSVSKKTTLDLTIYTLSASDTKSWGKVKQVTTKTATYLITVRQETSADHIFKHLVDEGETTLGFGINKEEVLHYNQTLGNAIKNAKNNRLVGMDYFEFSGEDKGLVASEWDYADQAFNQQKAQHKQFMTQLYQAWADKRVS
jgi:hypothetical protein